MDSCISALSLIVSEEREKLSYICPSWLKGRNEGWLGSKHPLSVLTSPPIHVNKTISAIYMR
jgi:hypothetical protein